MTRHCCTPGLVFILFSVDTPFSLIAHVKRPKHSLSLSFTAQCKPQTLKSFNAGGVLQNSCLCSKSSYGLIKFHCLPGSDKYGTSLRPLWGLDARTDTRVQPRSAGLPRYSVMDLVSADFWFLGLIVEKKI